MPLSTIFSTLLMIVSLFHISCRCTAHPHKKYIQHQHDQDTVKPIMSADSFFLLHYPDYFRFKSPRTSSPMDFLRALADTTVRLTLADQSTIPIPYVLVADDFPANWITTEQMDSLMPLIHSRKKCKCYISYLSSFLPHDSAHVGGFVIELVEAFKNNEPLDLGLWRCPKYDAEKAKQLSPWWAEHRLDSIN